MSKTIETMIASGSTYDDSLLCVTIAPLLAEVDDNYFSTNIGGAVEMPGGTIIELDRESFDLVRRANGDGSSIPEDDRGMRVRFQMKNWVMNDVDCSVLLVDAVSSIQRFNARPGTVVGTKRLTRCTHSAERPSPNCAWCLYVAVKACRKAKSENNSAGGAE